MRCQAIKNKISKKKSLLIGGSLGFIIHLICLASYTLNKMQYFIHNPVLIFTMTNHMTTVIHHYHLFSGCRNRMLQEVSASSLHQMISLTLHDQGWSLNMRID